MFCTTSKDYKFYKRIATYDGNYYKEDFIDWLLDELWEGECMNHVSLDLDTFSNDDLCVQEIAPIIFY